MSQPTSSASGWSERSRSARRQASARGSYHADHPDSLRSRVIPGALGTHEFVAVVAFSELELKRIDRTVGELCRKCSPAEHADELRTVYEVVGHSVTMYEERPPWDGVGEWMRRGIARLRFSRSRQEWQLYWMRQDLRWHLYDPAEMPADLASLVAVVEADKYGAFFG